MLQELLGHASLLLIFAALLVAGLGLPLPEDMVLLASGALAHRGLISLPLGFATCVAGVICGDLLIFTTAKRLGPDALERPTFRRLLGGGRRERVEALLSRHGGKVVFAARHLAGLRAPTFAVAGMHGMSTTRFLLWDGVGLCVSAPLVFGLGYYSSEHLDRVRAGVAHAEHWLLLVVAAAALVYAIWASWRHRRGGP